MAEKVRAIIKEDPQSTYLQIQEQLKIGFSSVYTILHEKLQMHWVCHRLVPHFLSPQQKQLRVEICKENPKIFKDGGHQIFSRIITSDETYVHYYDAQLIGRLSCGCMEARYPPL